MDRHTGDERNVRYLALDREPPRRRCDEGMVTSTRGKNGKLPPSLGITFATANKLSAGASRRHARVSLAFEQPTCSITSW